MDDQANEQSFALNLEGIYYSEPTIYDRERELIFKRSWQLAGPAVSVADSGSYLATTIAGYPIMIRRGEDGLLRGFRNICAHRGARLLDDGVGTCGKIVCPYHGWVYSESGRLEDTPWFGEPSPFRLGELHLHDVAVAEWRGLLFAAVEPDEPLEAQLGDLPREAASAPMETFIIQQHRNYILPVNWKSYLDQFNEFYHTPMIHGRDKAVGIQHYDTYPLKGMMRMAAPGGGASEAAFYGGLWIWGWPNWTLSFFPGGMKTSRVNPISARETSVAFDFYFTDISDASRDFREGVVTATESIFAEDSVAARLVQGSYESGAYEPGPLHPRLERSVAYFQSRVREALA